METPDEPSGGLLSRNWFMRRRRPVLADLMPNRTVRAVLAASWLVALTIAISACSTGSDAAGAPRDRKFQQVSDDGPVFTPNDLAAIGFRTSKEYSAEGLAGATDAVFGFWRPPGGDPIDYEIRFYASHDDAVILGTEPAREGSGEDAVLDAEKAAYKEGVRDRRMIIGASRSGTGPKYGDYAIVNNLVMLCAGADSGQSLERCSLLASALAQGAE